MTLPPLPATIAAVPPDTHPRVAEALAAVRAADLVAVLQELLAVPSVTGSDAESQAQHQLEPLMRATGLDTDLWPIDVDEIAADPQFPGMEAERDQAWGLVGAWGPDEGTRLVLNGHIDVVPPGEVGWSAGPWEGIVRDGRVVGRGACDMKGGLVCQLLAIRALREAGVRLTGQVMLQSVVGEEDGGLGTFATLRRGYGGDLAVICEPTRGRVVAATAGALTFRLVVTGRSVHASARLEGVDAFEKYLLIHDALRRLEEQRNVDAAPLMASYALPYPISVGRVSAGNWASSVPDQLIAEGRIGVRLHEGVAEARTALEGAVTAACDSDPWLRHHRVAVQWWGGQFAPGYSDPGAPVTRAVVDAHRHVHGVTPAVVGAPYGSDQRLLSGLGGIPTVLYGPGDVRHAHAPDESVAVRELVDVTRTLVMLISSTCAS